MRMSRILGQAQAVYNQRQKITNETDANYQAAREHAQQEEKKKKNERRSKARVIKLSTHKSPIIVKGIRFAGEEGLELHNRLLYNAQKIHQKTVIKMRNHKYRTSI